MKRIYHKLCKIMEPDEAVLNMILVPICIISLIVGCIFAYAYIEDYTVSDDVRQYMYINDRS